MLRSLSPYVIAFLSGACALVYQVVWMRGFTPVFGLSVYATTAVLCAFMGGLGLGSHWAPTLVASSHKNPWRTYAAIEVAIALGALVVVSSVHPITTLYSHVAGMDRGGIATSLVRFLLAGSVMVIPTFFMGLTLPVLVHAHQLDADDHTWNARRIGALYGFNTLGAALGCLVVGFVLLYRFGIHKTTWLTAGLNIGVAFLALLQSRRAEAIEDSPSAIPPADTLAQAPTTSQGPPPSSQSASHPRFLSPRMLLFTYALIGVTSFGYELSWFRILIYYLQGATYSFSIMLALFLTGNALGAMYFSRFLERRLDKSPPDETLKVLAVAQVFIGLFGIGTLYTYRAIPVIWLLLIRALGADSWTMITAQKAIVAGLIIVPPTFLMGLTFPLLARLLKRTWPADGRIVGRLYAANTVGAILGSLLTGFVFFNAFGVQATIILLASLNFLLGLGIGFPVARTTRRFAAALVAASILFALTLLLTPPRMLIANFEKFVGKIVFYRESAADVTFVYEDEKGARVLAFNDGRGTSSTNPTSNYVNRVQAYSTMAQNPDAQDVLVISLGCGNTASAYTAFPIRRLDLVDISAGAFEAAPYFPTNLDVLDDPRVHTWVEDGRNFLLRTDRQWDIIEIELPTLHTDGVVNLYTREFYEIAWKRLKPGGILSQWIDARQSQRDVAYRVANTMIQRFPHASAWATHWSWWINGIKQDHPFRFDYEKAKELFDNPRVKKDTEWVGSGLEDVLSRLVSAEDILRRTVGQAGIITDDRTVVDFLVPKLVAPSAFGGGIAYYSSPLGPLFVDYWKKKGVKQLTTATMLKFHASNHFELVDQSLRSVAGSIPPDVLKRLEKANDAWMYSPSPLHPW